MAAYISWEFRVVGCAALLLAALFLSSGCELDGGMEETASAQLAATTDDGVTDDGVTDDGVTDDGATDDGATDDGATNDGVADDECPDEADEVDDEEEIPDWLQDLLQPETSCERFRRVPDMFGD